MPGRGRSFAGIVALVALGAMASRGLAAEVPRLIVVVSVDQLCEDYLLRFADNFSDDGMMRRIAAEGAHYRECHHRHAFTVTAPGHSVQLTGAYPQTNGIVGNDWFDRYSGKGVYCVADPEVQVLGTTSDRGMSPPRICSWRLWETFSN
jgi:predicted AlkP superfamily pyrophosphatase or phosphodiesterase